MQFMKDSNIAKNLSKNASNISSIQDSQLSAFEGHFSGRRPSDQLPLPSMNSPLPTINEADKLIGNSHHQQMFQSNASSNPSRSLNPKERRIPFGEKSLLDEFLIQR